MGAGLSASRWPAADCPFATPEIARVVERGPLPQLCSTSREPPPLRAPFLSRRRSISGSCPTKKSRASHQQKTELIMYDVQIIEDRLTSLLQPDFSRGAHPRHRERSTTGPQALPAGSQFLHLTTNKPRCRSSPLVCIRLISRADVCGGVCVLLLCKVSVGSCLLRVRLESFFS